MTDKNKSEKKEDKKEKKVAKNIDKLVDEISKLSVLELSELVDVLQDKLGVSPMPVAAAPAAAAGGAAEESADEAAGGGDNQTVVLTGVGDSKISVIKALREINQELGLKDAKDATENLPYEVMKEAKADAAKEAVEKLKAAGAQVETK